MSEEINKIDLNVKDSNTPEKLVIIIVILALLAVVTIFGVVLPARAVLSSVNNVKASAKEAVDAAKNQNIDLAGEKLTKTRSALQVTQNKLNTMAWIKLLPFVGGYYSDAQHLLKAGFYG